VCVYMCVYGMSASAKSALYSISNPITDLLRCQIVGSFAHD